MNRFKKVSAMIMACVMGISLCACGGSKQASEQKSSKDYMYSYESFDFAKDINGDLIILEDGVIAVEYIYDEADVILPETRGVSVEGAELTVEEVALPEEAVTDEGMTEEIVTDEGMPEEDVADGEMPEEDIADGEIPEEDMGMEDYSDPGNYTIKVTKYDMSGVEGESFSLTFSGDTGMSGCAADGEGNFYLGITQYAELSENEVSTLYCYDMTGTEKWNIELSEVAKTGDYFYMGAIFIASTGEILINGNSESLVVVNKDGSYAGMISLGGSGDRVVETKDGKIAVVCYGDTEMYLQMVDLQQMKATDKEEMPYNSYMYDYYDGNGIYDFVLGSSSGLYYFNVGDEQPTMFMDFVDSDVSFKYFHEFKMIDETHFYAFAYDDDGNPMLAKFTKVDPATVKDKNELTIGCMWVDEEIRQQVIAYNRANEENRIKIIDYSIYETETDYMAGINKLNNDISSGNCPDIIVCNSLMPMDSYMSKGVFADLTDLMEADGTISKDDILPNVWNALSYDDRLYHIGGTFYLNTVVGKKSVVGDRTGWTIEDLNAVMAKQPAGTVAFAETTSEGIVSMSYSANPGQYVDWEKGECYFDTKEFIELLEYAATYPKEIDYNAIYEDENYWSNYEVSFREGKTLLSQYTFAGFEDYLYCEQGTFGEEITFIGFPGSGEPGAGSSLTLNNTFAISAKSKYKNAAWDFVKYFVSDEYYEEVEYGFPIRYSTMEKRIEKAQEKPYYLDENNQKVEYDNTYFVNGVEIVMEPMSKEKAEAILDKILEVDRVSSYDMEIIEIMTEEIKPYFEGQKSAQEVAEIIQSRIGIYIKENK